jgi:hypothetical protein
MPGLLLDVKVFFHTDDARLVCDHGNEVLIAFGSIELAGQLDSLATDGTAWAALFIPC